MAVDAQTIRDYVAANIDNPQAIASAAASAGVSVSDIASAMSLPEATVTNYFSSANVNPPASSYVEPSTGHLMKPTGNLTPEGTPEYLDVTGTQYNIEHPGGGLLSAQNIIAIGLAYALPVVGEAIAAQIGVEAATGTALAAIGTGVAQGKTIEESIKSAAPSLIANGIMSQVELNSLTDNIAKDPKLQNVVTNVANSTLKTAIAGGNAQDILTNAIATGGGTLIGQTTGQTIGQGLATTLATGDVIKGATAAAGSAGQAEATRNLVERQVGPIMNAPTSGVDAQTQSIINQLGLASQDPGVLTAANAPPNLNMVAASALPAMLGTANEKSGPIQAQTDPDGSVTYSRTITGVDASGKPYTYVATYDPLETTPNKQVSYSIPGTFGGPETAAPSVAGTVNAYTRPTFDTPTSGEGFGLTTPDVTISTSGVGDKLGKAPTTGGAGASDTQPSPQTPSGTVGGTATTAGEGTGAGGVAISTGGGGVGTGTGGAGLGTGGAGTGTGKGTGVGAGPSAGPEEGGEGGGEGTGTVTPSTTPVVSKTDSSVKTTPTVSDATDVSITTSAVKPKLKAAYPTISGQFASPLTQAVSAYRPPGEIESQETGKEKEPVWNVESLRNALGI